MPRIRPTEDIRPLSEFRANAAAFITQVQVTKRPLILTQHGRSAAVLLDVSAYEDLIEQAELRDDVEAAEGQIRAGRGLTQDKARSRILAKLRR